jgi:hypothetical protein
MGAIVVTGTAGNGAGAGFDGGFCAGLCAKAGEMGPAASRNASKAASGDLVPREAGRFTATSKLDWFRVRSGVERLEVPQRVFMMVFVPRDSVPTGRFDFHQLVKRVVNPCCYTKLTELLRRGMKDPGE